MLRVLLAVENFRQTPKPKTEHGLQIFLSRALSNAMPRQPHPNKSIINAKMEGSVRMYSTGMSNTYVRSERHANHIGGVVHCTLSYYVPVVLVVATTIVVVTS